MTTGAVKDYGSYKTHPLLDEFPLLTGRQFDRLVEDIRENGLGQSITLTADMSTIVDGRNRYLACDAALVDPHFKTLPASFTEEQIVDYIKSRNLRRKNVTTDDLVGVLGKLRQDWRDQPDNRARIEMWAHLIRGELT